MVLAAEEGQATVAGLVADLVSLSLHEAEERAVDRGLHHHIALSLRTAVEGLLEQGSVFVDAGEQTPNDSTWLAEAEPEPCLIDSWARGSLCVEVDVPPPARPATSVAEPLRCAALVGAGHG
jgi:hypothetical protein